jgi:molecular chaperone GrpE
MLKLLHRRSGILTEEQRQEAEEMVEAEAQDAEIIEEEPAEVPEQEGEEEPVDEVATLHQELEESRAKEAEYLDGWQRARAELANARKRFQREREQAYANAKADLLIRLLPVLDDFDRAFESLPDDPSTATWIDGVKLVQRKFLVFLEQEGVEAIESKGQEFDPLLHQAVTHEPSTDVPDGHIIAELQRGYRVGDRVLRAGVVRVSSGPSPETEPGTEAKEQEDETAVEES